MRKSRTFLTTGSNDTNGTLDTRGFQGVEGVTAYFQTVHLNIVVDTAESMRYWRNIKAAGVHMEANWSRKS